MKNPTRILICRTDSIGDVVLTLPVAAVLKNHYPESEIYFLGRNYTKPVIESCNYINYFLSWDDFLKQDEPSRVLKLKELNLDAVLHVFPRKEIVMLCKKALIPLRIGTTGRIYNWLGCNKRIALSRKNSDLHEAQLNIKLLKGFGIEENISLDQIPDYYGLNVPKIYPSELTQHLLTPEFRVILHPKSKGSAREWGLPNFLELARILSSHNIKVLLCGTSDEGILIKQECPEILTYTTDLTGKLSLQEYMSLISQSEALVAASTGPLHLAAALGKHAIGIYPPIRPMHPGRWAALGCNVKIFVLNKDCEDCRKGGKCHCMEEIAPNDVALYLISKTQ